MQARENSFTFVKLYKKIVELEGLFYDSITLAVFFFRHCKFSQLKRCPSIVGNNPKG